MDSAGPVGIAHAEPVYGTPRDFEESNPYPEFKDIHDPKEEEQGLLKRTMESNAFKAGRVAKKIYDMYGNLKSLLKFLAMAGIVVVVVAMSMGGEELHYKNGTVVTESSECSDVGVHVMKNDGNAVDAAIATSFCLGVVHPMSAGIGGGGIMMVQNGTDTPVVLDFRELAPKDIDENQFRGATGKNRRVGNDAIAIPGSIKGLYTAWNMFGKTPWSALVAPAIKLANDGFEVSPLLAKRISQNKAKIQYGSPELKDLFLPNGQSLKAGERLKMPKLGSTLEAIANDPLQWFTTSNYLTDLQSLDLLHIHIEDQSARQKQVIKRDPLRADFGDFSLYTAPPVSCGGSLLIAALNFFDLVNVATLGESAVSLHAMVEGMKLAYAQKIALGDPDNAFNLNMPDTVVKITSKSLAQQFLHSKYSESTTLPLANYSSVLPYYPGVESSSVGTASTVIGDPDGMIVSLTESIGDAFGSAVMLPRSGVIMNNHMSDFTVMDDVDAVNPNAIAEFKRPASYIAPSMINKKGKQHIALAGSGGNTIASALAQVVANSVFFSYSPKTALDRPRMHHDRLTDKLIVEKGMAQHLRTALTERHHQLQVVDSIDVSAVQLLLKQNDAYYPAADPRKNDKTPSGF